MFKNLHKVIAALGVFAMTIGSGFAMDINPPAEPVKAMVETEVVEEAPQQTLYMGFVAYKDALGNCIITMNPMHCTLIDTETRCTVKIGTNTYFLYEYVYDMVTNTWSCGRSLYEIPDPF